MKQRVERWGREFIQSIEHRFLVDPDLQRYWLPEPSEADAAWIGRLRRFRVEVIPWMARTRPFPDTRILEVGCGRGASTFALGEQGAHVDALDLDEQALVAAETLAGPVRDRVRFHCADASSLSPDSYPDVDWVVFWASLEHMTIAERLAALSGAWSLIPAGGLLTVVETPNRLWPYDSHTSRLPFYSWLPDDLAFSYAKFSQRDTFGGSAYTDVEAQMTDFLRRGRGVSFHEFDLALGDHRELGVAACMQLERRQRNPVRRIGWALSSEGAVERRLRGFSPDTPRAWFQPFLYITLRKA